MFKLEGCSRVFNMNNLGFVGGRFMANAEGVKEHRKKRLKRIRLGLFFIIMALILFGVKNYYDYLMEPVASENIKRIEIEIPSGSTTKTIAGILKKNDLIKNREFFVLISKINKNDGHFKAGKYSLNNGMALKEIIDSLIKGGASSRETVSITIPEGYEIKQIAEKLSELENFNKENFIRLVSSDDNYRDEYEFLKQVPKGLGLEGYLFPNTYEIYVDSTEDDIIRKMLDEFNKIYIKYIKGQELYKDFTLNDLIAMASIIERETRLDEERAVVSSVFYNRLEIDMKLGSCATVQYVLGERKSHLSIADTKIESPYNTYINKGLPIGPIASPGLKSIQAALNPDDTDYLYFVLTDYDKGKHTFTDNYNEFLRAKNAAKNQ
ncbi:endolytic transglycosylase MltG [Abyssisolibacter fermentans]|uniref:endolytic transglycosylase MltG n=1 Tax=Abyssisolibacter fermentans TaxID=1766203 RepID=UPI00138F69C0|nr:endolytic transglycosylase MltG [Abyssisolibacter fermentans]